MFSIVCLLVFTLLGCMMKSDTWLNLSIKVVLIFMAIWSLIVSLPLLQELLK